MNLLDGLLMRSAGGHASGGMKQRICVAVSGGCDSMALLSLICEYIKIVADRQGSTHLDSVCVVTVDHQLRSNSTQEAEFVSNFCANISVKHVTLNWDHESVEKQKIERAARSARYKILTDFCNAHSYNALIAAHTLDDQIETFLMREEKGSSPSGLSCMSSVVSMSSKVKLVRPLLSFYKNELTSWLEEKNIPWIHDSMNDDEDFLRVMYRKRISGFSMSQKEDYRAKIACFAAQRSEVEQKAVSFLSQNDIFSKHGYAEFAKASFDELSLDVKAEILKRAVWNIGAKAYTSNIKIGRAHV